MTKIKMLFFVLCSVSLLIVVGFANTGPDSDDVLRCQQEYTKHNKKLKNKDYFTLIDYSKPIFAIRLWVIDKATGKSVLSAHVAHPLNSGFVYASDFSNVNGSKKSCIGTFITQDEYYGRFGQAMRVVGLDASNDQALERAIVFHPTRNPYTWGCFATAPATNAELIALIKGGSLVYITR